MNPGGLLIILILLSSLIPGIAIFALKEKSSAIRTGLNLSGAVIKILLILFMDIGIFLGRTFELRLPLFNGYEMVLNADPLSALFATLSSVLWLLTTIYAVGYLEKTPNRSHFFGYFSLCVAVTIGIALAGNLITFLLFYEMLTLTTYPLIIHRGTHKALRAGRNYLVYTFIGGGIFFFAVMWIQSLTGPIDFNPSGFSTEILSQHSTELTIIFILFVCGIGVKAALFPFHGWLPQAMVAPAPVSALLHAVAVVKAGAFGIVRVVLDVYGLANVVALKLLPLLTFAACITIIYGSLRALQQDDLKRRLAFSTVSQISYIALGVSLAEHPAALIGGLVHLVHQGLMKITLFFCAGNLAETLGIHRVKEMHGVARRMPWTMAAFTICALGMIGIPPTAGFVSKWYLAIGALDAGTWEIIAILLVSSLLNACYFLPIIKISWLDKQQGIWPEEQHLGRLETHWMLLIPTLITALLAVMVGSIANAEFSPLAWVRFIIKGYIL